MFSLHYFSRKRLILITTMLFMAFMISACGTGETGNGSNGEGVQTTTANSSQAGEANSVEEAGVKTVSTINGDIEIPVNPQRIVAEEYLGSLIALDVIPVGAPGLTIQNYYFKDFLQGIEDIGDYGKPSIEKIVALNPDLIITGNGEKTYEQLSKIAPTIVIPYGDLKNAQEELTYFGELFGKEEEAKTWLEAYDRRIAEAKAKVDAVVPADATFSIMEDGEKSTWVYGDNFGRGGQPVYQALGRKPPSGIAAEIMEKQWAELSAEMVSQYAGDYIIMTANTRTIEDFKADPIWSTLSAVKKGQMYIWPEERSWYYDPLAVLAQTEELAEWLSKKN
ncbi:ABC transporter substrate-binding protein [Bacillus sp. FJAT-18019]|uniref:ABC transporter substrate-binding protein n=1 Tax=Paenibacillus solani TaxID=1705565 RepID=A0A0M1NIY7_9BACL|nr:ABC transporter substrate-binding protein [Paenibacillus solani]KOP66964.1 ABC transporter substrate-binding protein [Bacillus sp. FJAT-18019]KOR82223.1 ABC transporter substrate-binding protein [Paenibacillus solani]